MKYKKQVTILIALVALAVVIGYVAQPKERVVFDIAQEQDTDTTLNETPLVDGCPEARRDAADLPAGRKLFVDPLCRFSFQYVSDGFNYTIERIGVGYGTDIPNSQFSLFNPIGALGVGITITHLRYSEKDMPVYDYKRLTSDPTLSGSFEKIELNGYPSYKAVFSYEQYPERYLFIHIPHEDQLFTLHRSTTDQAFIFEQFSVISETFKLLK